MFYLVVILLITFIGERIKIGARSVWGKGNEITLGKSNSLATLTASSEYFKWELL